MNRILALSIAPLLALAACGDKGAGGRDITSITKLHRGELAAVASYDDAIAKFPNMTGVDLSRLRDEHRQSADALADRVRALGGTPDTSAGPWGAWAELVTKGASVAGAKSALEALRMGEKHGQDEYDDALKSARVDDTTKDLIRATLLPRVQAHLKALEDAARVQ